MGLAHIYLSTQIMIMIDFKVFSVFKYKSPEGTLWGYLPKFKDVNQNEDEKKPIAFLPGACPARPKCSSQRPPSYEHWFPLSNDQGVGLRHWRPAHQNLSAWH